MITDESLDSLENQAEVAELPQLDVSAASIFDNEQRYGFKVGQLGFLYPKDMLGELVKKPGVCPIPHTHRWMLGVINLRGNLIPVVDLKACIQGVEPISPATVLVLDKGKTALAFALESSPVLVTKIEEVSKNATDIPELFVEDIMKTYKDAEDVIWLEFNQDKLFSKLGQIAKSC